LKGFSKAHPFIFFKKSERITALTTAKTLVPLEAFIDKKRRTFLAMKWTETPKIGAASLDRDSRPNDINDVAGFFYFLDL